MGKKFIMSYSGGKDSALALYRTLRDGHEPIALFTTYDNAKGRNWFHGLDETILKVIEQALNIPIWLVGTNGYDYSSKVEETLFLGKKLGADFCVFGDIFIEAHYDWCRQRCENVGIESSFPLFGEKSEDLLNEFVDKGFKGTITIVDLKRLNTDYLGRVLDSDILREFRSLGIDVCGEYGEYHTIVSDGPIFRHPMEFNYEEIDLSEAGYAKLPIKVKM